MSAKIVEQLMDELRGNLDKITKPFDRRIVLLAELNAAMPHEQFLAALLKKEDGWIHCGFQCGGSVKLTRGARDAVESKGLAIDGLCYSAARMAYSHGWRVMLNGINGVAWCGECDNYLPKLIENN